jgi:hypothetical protein
MRKKKRRVSDNQTSLVTSQSKRQQENVEYLKAQVKIAVASVHLAKQLSEDAGTWGYHLERYLDRLGPDSWWLHTELHMSEEYPGAPNIDNYGMGGYWMGHNPAIDEFVKARAKWILPQLEEEARSYLFELKNQEAKGKLW